MLVAWVKRCRAGGGADGMDEELRAGGGAGGMGEELGAGGGAGGMGEELRGRRRCWWLG